MKVIVTNSFDKALRIFRKKVEKSGVLKDLKNKEYYEKPSTKANVKKQYHKRTNKKALESVMPYRQEMLLRQRNRKQR